MVLCWVRGTLILTETAKPKASGELGADRLKPEKQVERSAARYLAFAHEHRIDLSNDGFSEALRNVSRRLPNASNTNLPPASED